MFGRESREERKPENTSDRIVLTPAVDVYEHEAALVIVAEVPGVPKDQVKIAVHGRDLELEAVRSASPKQRAVEYRRSFRLPAGVSHEGISAEHRAGLLTLTLPKLSAQGARQIPIHAS
jgi:HSP20 family protein